MMGKREAFNNIVDGKGADRIPVVMCVSSLPSAQAGIPFPETLFDPEKMAGTQLDAQRRLGYDGFITSYVTLSGMLAGHLPDSEGNTGMGSDTIHSYEDLDKLAPYDPAKDPCLAVTKKAAESLRKEAPDEPILAIIQPASGLAFDLMGAKTGFKSMVKDHEFFRAVCDRVEDAAVAAYEALWDSEIDAFWFPTPNFGGYCISRNTYIKCIHDSNKRFYKRMQDAGVRMIHHTCGLYDDRLDLCLEEHNTCWHLADTSTKKIKDLYGDKMSLMGTIPSVRVLLEGTADEVYKFAYQECIDAAQDGRFILSGDCDVPPDTADENIFAVIKAAKDAEKVIFG